MGRLASLEEALYVEGAIKKGRTPPYVEGATTYSGALAIEKGAIFRGGRLAYGPTINHKAI